MKIAYLIMCHMDPEFVQRTAIKLSNDRNHVFIHVDKKQDISEYIFEHNNVHFCRNRIENYWGGWNAVIATINLLKKAMETESFDRYVLLQGQDYPLYSNEYIEEFFNKYSDIEFCRAYNLTHTKDNKDSMKVYGYWFIDKPKSKISKVLRYPIKKICSICNKNLIKYRKGYYVENGVKYEVYSGWAQWAITEQCAKYILEFYETHKKFNSYFKYSFPPDEIYFHTIIYNSKFAKKTVDSGPINSRSNEKLLNLTYFEYPDQIRVFKSVEDYEKLMNSGCLFARKFNSQSESLLDYIDSQHKDINKRLQER